MELISRRSQLYWCSDATQGDACVGAASSGGVASAPERQPTLVEWIAFPLNCRGQWYHRNGGAPRLRGVHVVPQLLAAGTEGENGQTNLT